MVIILPGHYFIAENEIYLSVTNSNFLQRLILFKRFVQPTKDDVVEYIHDQFKELKGVTPDTSGNWTDLERAIIDLPKNMRLNFGLKSEDSIDFLKEYTSAADTKDILNTIYGILPREIVQENLSTIGNPEYCRKLMDMFKIHRNGFGEVFNYDWSYDSLLGENKKSLLKSIRNEVKNISRPEAFTELKNFINTISTGLAEREMFELVPVDQSLSKSIEELALEPLKLVHQVLERQKKESETNDLMKTQAALQNAFKGK